MGPWWFDGYTRRGSMSDGKIWRIGTQTTRDRSTRTLSALGSVRNKKTGVARKELTSRRERRTERRCGSGVRSNCSICVDEEA